MKRWAAEWLHRNLPFRFIGTQANNALAGWAWGVVPDPESPASVQAWWAKGDTDGATLPPPKFRPRPRP